MFFVHVSSRGSEPGTPLEREYARTLAREGFDRDEIVLRLVANGTRPSTADAIASRAGSMGRWRAGLARAALHWWPWVLAGLALGLFEGRLSRGPRAWVDWIARNEGLAVGIVLLLLLALRWLRRRTDPVEDPTGKPGA